LTAKVSAVTRKLQQPDEPRPVAIAPVICVLVPLNLPSDRLKDPRTIWIPSGHIPSFAAERGPQTLEEQRALLEYSQAVHPSKELCQILRNDSRVVETLRRAGEDDPRCIALLIELNGPCEASEAEDNPSWPEIRDLVLKALEGGAGSVASTTVHVPGGAAFGEFPFPPSILRLVASVCPDLERGRAFWNRVESGESSAAAAAKNKLVLPRGVSGSVALTGLRSSGSGSRAEEHLHQTLQTLFRSAFPKNRKWEFVEFRGHVSYAGSDVPVHTLERMTHALRGILKTAVKNKAASVTDTDFSLDLRLKSRQDRPQLVGPRVVGRDSWLNEHQLPKEEDVVSGVTKDESGTEGAREAVRAFAATLPSDYLQQKQALVTLYAGVRSEIAAYLGPALNAHCSTLPQQTYDEKRALAKWVNAELRQFGLAIKCPKTGQSAYLVAHPGGRPGIGRFHLEVAGPDGSPQRTLTSAVLPELALIPETTPVKAGTTTAPTRAR